jgi:uncharacterized integral membrane protein (TIGR00697 family)
MYPLLACGEDYINEFYGKKLARSSVFAQLIVRVLTTLFLVWIIFLPPPASGQENFDMFAKLMGIVPRVAFASITATYLGGLLNVHLFAKLKDKTNGDMLWLRVVVSTSVGLTLNAFIFTLLAFVGVRPWNEIVQMVILSVSVRLVTGVIELVFLYFMKYLQKSGIILRDATDLVISPTDKALAE